MKATLVIPMCVVLSACSGLVLTDVSDDPELKPVVGTQFEIVGAVDAYGIRRHSKAEVEYITLIPRPGIAGSEVGYRIPVELGSVVTVTKVMKTNRWLGARHAFIVTLEKTPMPTEVEIRIELDRGNEGGGKLLLNPSIYRKIDAKAESLRPAA